MKRCFRPIPLPGRLRMAKRIKKAPARRPPPLPKCPTGIKGFDEITEGGLPRSRTTLLSGGTGTGKTLFCISFLINGVTKYEEPGILMSFEETEEELYQDVATLNLDLRGLVAKKRIHVEHVRL